jgi:hypothetical protein
MYEAAPSTKVSIGAPAGHREPGCPKEHNVNFSTSNEILQNFPETFRALSSRNLLVDFTRYFDSRRGFTRAEGPLNSYGLGAYEVKWGLTLSRIIGGLRRLH